MLEKLDKKTDTRLRGLFKGFRLPKRKIAKLGAWQIRVCKGGLVSDSFALARKYQDLYNAGDKAAPCALHIMRRIFVFLGNTLMLDACASDETFCKVGPCLFPSCQLGMRVLIYQWLPYCAQAADAAGLFEGVLPLILSWDLLEFVNKGVKAAGGRSHTQRLGNYLVDYGVKTL